MSVLDARDVGTGLPAGVGLSHVRVYRTTGPDGLAGGTPHLHLACAEMYVVLSGSGSVQLLTTDGPREVTLTPGKVVTFSPGTIHRLLNPSESLRILVVMENGRLNEEGDTVFPFPAGTLADADAYHRAADVGPAHDPDPQRVERRRDLAVAGYVALLDLWRDDAAAGRAALRRLFERGAELVHERAATWPDVVARGAEAAAAALGERARAVADRSDLSHLEHAEIAELDLDEDALVPRMCGDLWSYRRETPAC